jgi:hypothetical protein
LELKFLFPQHSRDLVVKTEPDEVRIGIIAMAPLTLLLGADLHISLSLGCA